MTELSELARLTGTDVAPQDIASIIERILPAGHAIHGHSDSLHRRMLIIVESHETSSGPLLGFGMDGNAERALVRALATYVKREQLGIDYITETQFDESTKGQIGTGHHPSRFDNIVWGGRFRMWQDGTEVVARSAYGGGHGLTPLEVRAATPLGAVTLLADQYRFIGGFNPEGRPAISLE